MLDVIESGERQDRQLPPAAEGSLPVYQESDSDSRASSRNSYSDAEEDFRRFSNEGSWRSIPTSDDVSPAPYDHNVWGLSDNPKETIFSEEERDLSSLRSYSQGASSRASQSGDERDYHPPESPGLSSASSDLPDSDYEQYDPRVRQSPLTFSHGVPLMHSSHVSAPPLDSFGRGQPDWSNPQPQHRAVPRPHVHSSSVAAAAGPVGGHPSTVAQPRYGSRPHAGSAPPPVTPSWQQQQQQQPQPMAHQAHHHLQQKSLHQQPQPHALQPQARNQDYHLQVPSQTFDRRQRQGPEPVNQHYDRGLDPSRQPIPRQREALQQPYQQQHVQPHSQQPVQQHPQQQYNQLQYGQRNQYGHVNQHMVAQPRLPQHARDDAAASSSDDDQRGGVSPAVQGYKCTAFSKPTSSTRPEFRSGSKHDRPSRGHSTSNPPPHVPPAPNLVAVPRAINAPSTSASSVGSSSKSQFPDDFSDFLRRLRDAPTVSEKAALCQKELALYSDAFKSKAYSEVADAAKRANKPAACRKFFALAVRCNPSSAKVWHDWVKFEEERGHWHKAVRVIQRALDVADAVDQLVIRGIKVAERMGDYGLVRSLLSKMRAVPLDKSWKALCEGAAFEARLGNVQSARRIFQYILSIPKPQGMAYVEAIKLEERCLNLDEAQRLALESIALLPKYNPVWFCALHIYAKKQTQMPTLVNFVQQAVASVPIDVCWRFWFDLAMLESKNGMTESAVQFFQNSVSSCRQALLHQQQQPVSSSKSSQSSNQSQQQPQQQQQFWRIWLGAARAELLAYKSENARRLLERADACAPKKSRHMVLLEMARAEEFEGNVERARSILSKAKADLPTEWKLHLETILLEYRAKQIRQAKDMAQSAVSAFPGAGRLWAIWIALSQFDGVQTQEAIFRKAVDEVGKSGEVWCEGARLRMNPLSPLFDLVKARRCLDFAIQFTPQYGDSFIEYIRLELLCNGPSHKIEDLKRYCMHVEPNYGILWSACRSDSLSTPLQILNTAQAMITKELHENRGLYSAAIIRSNSKYIRPPYAGIEDVRGKAMSQLRYPAQNQNCILCDRPLNREDVCVLACRHIFHVECSRSLVLCATELHSRDSRTEMKLCPLCNAPWVVVEYFALNGPAFMANAPRRMSLMSSHSSSDSSHPGSTPSGPNSNITQMFLLMGQGLRDNLLTTSASPPTTSTSRRARSSKTKAIPSADGADPITGFFPARTRTPHDFITGIIEVNHDMTHIREAKLTTRQRILFGSDSATI